MFIFFTCFLSNLIAQNTSRIEQISELGNNVRREAQIKTYLMSNNLSSFIDYEFFLKESRQKILRDLDLNDYAKDSLIFVEYSSLISSGYACSYYKSGENDYSTLYINRGDLKEEYLSPNKSMTQYVLEQIKKGNLDLILELGKKEKLYPADNIYIVIAVRDGTDYTIKSYSPYYFIIKKDCLDF